MLRILFRQDIPARPATATLRILVGDASSAKVGSLIIALSRVNMH